MKCLTKLLPFDKEKSTPQPRAEYNDEASKSSLKGTRQTYQLGVNSFEKVGN